MIPVVADLSHHNEDITSFANAKKAGLWGVIHKATEGDSIVDSMYVKNRKAATDAGLLWGAYHFFRPGNIEKQVAFFLRNAKPKEGTLLCLDHEDAGNSVADVELFFKTLAKSSNQIPVLYSGHLIKQQLGNQVSDYLAHNSRLWLAQYGTDPVVQATWDIQWLWQFTGDGEGPGPHSWPGLGDNIDLSHFDGTYDDLVDEWAVQRGTEPPVKVPTPQYHRKVPAKPAKDDIISWGQASLNFLNASLPELVVDGILGPKTETTLRTFQVALNVPSTGLFDNDTVAAICNAITTWSADRR